MLLISVFLKIVNGCLLSASNVVWYGVYTHGILKKAKILPGLLLKWFETHGRSFPWRVKGGNLFPLLVAEILLKKTRAATANKLYPKLLRRYPTAHDLSAAAVAELSRLLQPIGLSEQRAEHLINLSTVLDILEQPLESSSELSKLAGVGPYTAAIVGAVHFAEQKVGMDTNVTRVISRVFALEKTRAEARKSPEIWQLGATIAAAAAENVAELNWAFLDLGAMVCKLKIPTCTQCPLREHCCYARRKFAKQSIHLQR